MGNNIVIRRNQNDDIPKITVVYHRKSYLLIPFEIRYNGEIVPIGNWTDDDWDNMVVTTVYSSEIDFERGILKH